MGSKTVKQHCHEHSIIKIQTFIKRPLLININLVYRYGDTVKIKDMSGSLNYLRVIKELLKLGRNVSIVTKGGATSTLSNHMCNPTHPEYNWKKQFIQVILGTNIYIICLLVRYRE